MVKKVLKSNKIFFILPIVCDSSTSERECVLNEVRSLAFDIQVVIPQLFPKPILWNAHIGKCVLRFGITEGFPEGCSKKSLLVELMATIWVFDERWTPMIIAM